MTRDKPALTERQKDRIRTQVHALAVERKAAKDAFDERTRALEAAVQIADAAGIPHQQIASAALVYRPQIRTWVGKGVRLPGTLPTHEAALAAVAEAGKARKAAQDAHKDVTKQIAKKARAGVAAGIPQTQMAEWSMAALSTVRVWLGLRKYNEGR